MKKTKEMDISNVKVSHVKARRVPWNSDCCNVGLDRPPFWAKVLHECLFPREPLCYIGEKH